MKERIMKAVRAAGFDLAGVAPAMPLDEDFRRFEEWLDRGEAAGMDYLARSGRLRLDPRALLSGARSVIVAAAAYRPIVPPAPLAAYAACPDYHAAFRRALEEVAAAIRALAPEARCRAAVDTAPLLERALAARAGIGWVGRSTNLVTERFGPYVLLGEILTDLAIDPDSPRPERCGDCGRCIESCPTGALAVPYRLDARRCISYLTIEKRDPFTAAEAEWIRGGGSPGRGHAFGCDLCLACCPHAEDLIAGKVKPAGILLEPLPGLAAADFAALERLCAGGFRKNFGATPVARAGKKGFSRNLEACR